MRCIHCSRLRNCVAYILDFRRCWKSVFAYLSSGSILRNVPRGKAKSMLPMRIRSAVLPGISALLSDVKRESGTHVVPVDISNGDASSDLDRLFINMGVRGMLEGKDFQLWMWPSRFWLGLLIKPLDTRSLLRRHDTIQVTQSL